MPYFGRGVIQERNAKIARERAEKRKPAKYAVGQRVDYFKGGICYPSIIQDDLGITSSAGRKYRIVAHCPVSSGQWDMCVAERTLAKGD